MVETFKISYLIDYNNHLFFFHLFISRQSTTVPTIRSWCAFYDAVRYEWIIVIACFFSLDPCCYARSFGLCPPCWQEVCCCCCCCFQHCHSYIHPSTIRFIFTFPTFVFPLFFLISSEIIAIMVVLWDVFVFPSDFIRH